MVKNRYKNNLQDFACLANYWIFIQNGTLLPTGISFPKIILYVIGYLLIYRFEPFQSGMHIYFFTSHAACDRKHMVVSVEFTRYCFTNVVAFQPIF